MNRWKVAALSLMIAQTVLLATFFVFDILIQFERSSKVFGKAELVGLCPLRFWEWPTDFSLRRYSLKGKYALSKWFVLLVVFGVHLSGFVDLRVFFYWLEPFRCLAAVPDSGPPIRKAVRLGVFYFSTWEIQKTRTLTEPPHAI